MTEAEPAASRARELIAQAGLRPADDELVVFEMMYPLLRRRADTVYALDLGYEA